MTLRHFAWQAWHLATSTFASRGRRCTWSHLPSSFCVAGMAFAWHLVASTFVSRGRGWHLGTSTCVLRGSRGTWRHTSSFCVASVALCDIHLRFAWQAWHLATTTFVSRGGRIRLRFAWQAWRLGTPTCVFCGRPGTCLHTWYLFVTHNFVTHHLSHTIVAHYYWKKLTCGVIRSFNFLQSYAAIGVLPHISPPTTHST